MLSVLPAPAAYATARPAAKRTAPSTGTAQIQAAPVALPATLPQSTNGKIAFSRVDAD